MWWAEDDWYDDDKHYVMLVRRIGWEYRMYVAEVTPNAYVVRSRASDGMTAAEITDIYDLCNVVDAERVVMCGCF